MKKYLKLLFIFSLFILTGCKVAQVDTKLVINSNFSGQRLMTFTLDRETIAADYDGLMSDATKVIKEAAPKNIDIHFDEGKVTYYATISFDSIEDYQKKVESITSKKVEIEIDEPKSISTGLSIIESFSSKDLLDWIGPALVDAELISSFEANNLYELQDTVVEINGGIYDAANTIEINTLESISIDDISIYTSLIDQNKFNRSIIFKLSDKQLNHRRNEVYENFKSLVPKNMIGEWSQEGEIHYFTIDIKNVDFDNLMKYTNSIFKNKNEDKTYQESTNPFTNYQRVRESIDFSYFINDTSTKINYYLKASNKLKIVNETTTNKNEVTEDGYTKIIEDFIDDPKIDFGYSTYKDLRATKIDINLEMNNFTKKIIRTSSIWIDGIPNDDEIELIVEKLKGGIGSKEIDQKLFSIEVQPHHDYLVVIITQSGNVKQIQESSTYLFGTNNKFEYNISNQLFSFFNECEIKDQFDYQSIVDFTDDFIVRYDEKTFDKPNDIYQESVSYLSIIQVILFILILCFIILDYFILKWHRSIIYFIKDKLKIEEDTY